MNRSYRALAFGAACLRSFAAAFLCVPLWSQEPGTIPSNVPEGFLPPLSIESNVTHKAFFRSPAAASGPFVLQYSGTGFPSIWRDADAIERQTGIFEVEAGSAFRLYRFKSLASGDQSFSIELTDVVRSTTSTLNFPFLAGWEHYLQTHNASDGTWRTLSSYPIMDGSVTVTSDDAQPLRILATPPVRREEYEAIFVGGQSNAEIGDDWYYPHKLTNVLYIDQEIRFRNPAAFQDARKDWPWGYSFAVGAASLLNEEFGTRYLLVPVAVGGTAMSQWMPRSNRFDRSTLFGRANFRRVAAAPHPIRAIWYYGHESSTGFPEVTNYIAEWKALISEFQKEIGPVPIIFAQLAKSTDSWMHSNIFRGAEQQRLSEEGQPNGTKGHHMVVTFDLPLGDGLHLSGEANRLLGIRFARAMREHVYGEPIDGTGPRLVSVSRRPGDKRLFQVTFTQQINQPVDAYDHQFLIRDNDGEIPIADLKRMPDGFSVEIHLTRDPSGPSWLSYGEPRAAANLLYLTNVVRNAEGLPAPCFGPLLVE